MIQAQASAKCSVCERPFVRRNSLHRVCSPRCAVKTVRQAKAAEKAALKSRQEAAKPRSAWLKDAQAAFNAYIRKRDENQPCICCGKWSDSETRGGTWDCGHYRSTGSAPHLRFDERNAHRQLKQCNRYGAGRAVDYRIGLIARIGQQAVDALESDQTARKYTVSDLRAIRNEYKQKLKAMQ